MKAVILAGGEGVRIRPLSLGRPKPLLPLMGRPVAEHIIGKLKKHGITEIFVTLGYQAQAVRDALGTGELFGVRLHYVVEEEPLGTAGSVRRCLPELGGEDFLVIGGDCIFDLDLTAAMRRHRERRAEATLVLYRHPDPTQYGLAVTDRTGTIQRFVEKPSWGEVMTNTINTGIYILSPAAMARVPEGKACDFGRDLFPDLLREGRVLHGCILEGYWRDIGDCGAYLDCVCDALAGKVKLESSLPQIAPGIWSAAGVPEGVSLVPPCWIGPEVMLGAGAIIGPHVVLERGAWVGARAMVQRSVLMEGAGAGPRSTLYGAVLGRQATARRGSVLNEGVVLGEHALAEDGAVLMERVRLWPGQAAPAHCRVTGTMTGGSQKGALRFRDGGVIYGVPGEDLGPEALLLLGSVLAADGSVGIGSTGTPVTQMLSRAAQAGVAAAGGQAVLHDLHSPVQGAWVAARQELPVSLFLEESDGGVWIHFFDGRGLPLGKEREQKLEHTLLRGEVRRVRGAKVEEGRSLPLTQRQWADETARQAKLKQAMLKRPTVAVEGTAPENSALREALLALGCHVEERWRAGIPAFWAEHGGFRLYARDEKGACLDPGQMLALVTLIEMENGAGTVAVPAGASAAVDLVAAGYNGTVLRLDRDGSRARECYGAMPWLWSAPAAAVRICSRMGVSNQKLESLMTKTPRFHAWKREVPLSAERGRVMEALAARRERTEEGEGLRLRTGSGWVYVVPLARRPALRILAEGPDLELAAELCDFYAARAAELDRAQKSLSEREKEV